MNISLDSITLCILHELKVLCSNSIIFVCVSTNYLLVSINVNHGIVFDINNDTSGFNDSSFPLKSHSMISALVHSRQIGQNDSDNGYRSEQQQQQQQQQYQTA